MNNQFRSLAGPACQAMGLVLSPLPKQFYDMSVMKLYNGFVDGVYNASDNSYVDSSGGVRSVSPRKGLSHENAIDGECAYVELAMVRTVPCSDARVDQPICLA